MWVASDPNTVLLCIARHERVHLHDRTKRSTRRILVLLLHRFVYHQVFRYEGLSFSSHRRYKQTLVAQTDIRACNSTHYTNEAVLTLPILEKWPGKAK